MIYFDTSYLVRLYYLDPGADQVRALATSDHVACAAHGQAEMMAAFHRKLREGVIRPAAYAALVGQVEAHIEAGAFQWLPQDGEVLSRVRHAYQRLSASVFLRRQPRGGISRPPISICVSQDRKSQIRDREFESVFLQCSVCEPSLPQRLSSR